MPTELAKLNLPEEKFILIFQGAHGLPTDQARSKFHVEAFNFKTTLQEKPELLDCTELSIKNVFLDVISNGLSFSPTAKQVYMQANSCKTGRQIEGRDEWEKRLSFAPAPDGKIYLCQRARSLDRIQGPVIVYEGDHYQTGTDRQGNTWVEHAPGPRTSTRIIAGFVWQVFPNGTKNAVTMDILEVQRRAGYSAKRNKGAANALYTNCNGGIDPGFFGAKLIDAATKGLRKQEINSKYVFNDAEQEDEIPIDHEPYQELEQQYSIEQPKLPTNTNSLF